MEKDYQQRQQRQNSRDGILQHVTDDFFLKNLRRDPRAVICRIPRSVAWKYHDPIATMNDGFALRGDIYYRDRNPVKRRPALIYLHDWAGGKQPVIAGERQCAYLALKENIFTVSLYYRQPSDARFPAAIHDLKCALRWLRSVADEYAIDPEQLIVTGSSAGTQWAWLAAATSGQDVYNNNGGFEDHSSEVNMAVIMAGICDFFTDFGRQRIGIEIIGGTVDEMPERFKEACPLRRIRAGMPPVLMIHGEKDPICRLESAQAAYRKMRELDVPAELVVIEGAGHSTQTSLGAFTDNLDVIRKFIRDFF